ncbi:hypothetical protein VNO77_04302 [Canavalia gladiata]|uniref:Transmembrane protein n=1 Tax=Canavalia gladiata TaxID=3824 RepID=A0AAN9R7M7_CANGL
MCYKQANKEQMSWNLQVLIVSFSFGLVSCVIFLLLEYAIQLEDAEDDSDEEDCIINVLEEIDCEEIGSTSKEKCDEGEELDDKY